MIKNYIDSNDKNLNNILNMIDNSIVNIKNVEIVKNDKKMKNNIKILNNIFKLYNKKNDCIHYINNKKYILFTNEFKMQLYFLKKHNDYNLNN